MGIDRPGEVGVRGLKQPNAATPPDPTNPSAFDKEMKSIGLFNKDHLYFIYASIDHDGVPPVFQSIPEDLEKI
ncbi:unnamed protein product [Thelazia callipaeda]|uniref:Pyridoxamine 5'-phosphate oxidase n=1 Tax=Thelazia callipaeda TaxID=103827 RepID=A0A0N5DBW6_THECL|nr:unnamed protein product [Thelazia callipaeda]